MYVADNYGARWVKSMLSWARQKTLEPYPYPMIIRDGVLECGQKRGKMIELINEWIDLGFIINDGNMLSWCDPAFNINIGKSKEPDPAIREKMKAYRESKKKLQQDEKEEVLADEEVKKMLKEKFNDDV